MRKFGGLLALVALAAAGLFVAVAAFGPQAAAPASGDGSVSWTGQGANSVTACSPDEQPFLHWIFTTGGANGNTVSAVTLTLGGSGSGSYAMSQHGESWTADTGFFDLAGLTAEATYTGQLGSGESNLVISGGCYGATTTTGTTTTTTTTETTTTSTTGTTSTGTTSTTGTTTAAGSTTGTTTAAGSTTGTTTTGPLTPPPAHHRKHHQKPRHHKSHHRAHHRAQGTAQGFRPPQKLPHTL